MENADKEFSSMLEISETKPIIPSSTYNSKLCVKYCSILAPRQTHNCSSSIAVTKLIFLAIDLRRIQAEQVASRILKNKINAYYVSKGATFSQRHCSNCLTSC